MRVELSIRLRKMEDRIDEARKTFGLGKEWEVVEAK